MNRAIRVIISGGGTGGHIFPAIAIAGEIRKRFPGSDLLFVGAAGRMEMERVPAAGYPIIGLPVTGYPRKPGWATLRFAFNLAVSLVRAHRIVKRFKPDLAIGVGGYASGPLLRAAIRQKVPVLIQEQNSYAGITNKMLARKANTICVAYEGMEQFFPAARIVMTGNPVREILPGMTDRPAALAHFNFSSGRPVLLVTGGSLGARSLNEAVAANLETIGRSGLQVLWQTGASYAREFRERAGSNLPGGLRMVEFIDRMEYAYAAADLVVARAGAGTISELCLAGKPVILVPSPHVAEDHQTRNALALVNRDAAVMLKDSETASRLFPLVLDLLNDPPRRVRLSGKIREMAMPEAAARIVDEACKLIRP